MTGDGKLTTDHDFIRRWVEARQGKPALRKWVRDNEVHERLWIALPDKNDYRPVELISWEKFFEEFEKERLVFIYKDEAERDQEGPLFTFV